MSLPGDRATPVITWLRVKNYRGLNNLELRDLTPLIVFVGPNGSGKSMLVDVFAFLSECFTVGLREAWDKRGRFRELRTRGSSGPIVIQIKYREPPILGRTAPLITYQLVVNEDRGGPFVEEEWMRWNRRGRGTPFKFLDFHSGQGEVTSGELPGEDDTRTPETLESRDLLAVSTLGRLAKNPRAVALRRFITDWYLSYLTADSTRGVPEAGAQERLSLSGDNLPKVLQYLKEQHPDRLSQITEALTARVSRLERVDASVLADRRLMLQIKDAPFVEPILARFTSDATLKMLAYLTVLYDPSLPQLIGIEEPENELHQRLLPVFTEVCLDAADRAQLLVTTDSPFFLNGLRSEETWVLYRDDLGHTQAWRTSAMPNVRDLLEEGAQLGDLWMQGFFDADDPLRPGLRLPWFEV